MGSGELYAERSALEENGDKASFCVVSAPPCSDQLIRYAYACRCCLHHVQISPPTVNPTSPLQMMTANIDYDNHLGRIAIGRVVSGTIKKGQSVSICSSLEPGKVGT